MDLFNQETLGPTYNQLPYDGTVNYYGTVFSLEECKNFYDLLMEQTDWQADQAIIFGKQIFTKRKVAWYGTKPFPYTYSNTTKHALLFSPCLVALKRRVEELTGETYNSCLLNLYHSGQEGMAWHSDAEKELKKNGAIASLSFGATRTFCFKHKINLTKIDIVLENGSLLVMKDETQTHWLHRIPPTKKVKTPRINLTFRKINE